MMERKGPRQREQMWSTQPTPAREVGPGWKQVHKSEEKEEYLGEQFGIVLCEATNSRHRCLHVSKRQ